MSASCRISETIFIFVFTLMVLLFWEGRTISAQRRDLPEQEKQALHEVADQLGKTDWDFTLNPCDRNSNWTSLPPTVNPTGYNNSVMCNCSYPDGFCHIESIRLKAQDLGGVLPPSLGKFPYLKTIDLSRNYLGGTIPPEWTKLTNLEYLCVCVNRLSGPMPKYLGNITSLTHLSLENNFFNGTVPAELGKLVTWRAC